MPRAGTAASPSARALKMTSNMRLDGGQAGVELDAGEERPEEAVDDPGGEAAGPQLGHGGQVLAPEQGRRVDAAHTSPEQGQASAIGDGPDRSSGRRPERPRAAERVLDAMAAAVDPDQRAGFEGLEPEAGDVELPVELGIGGEDHLEAAIQPEAIDLVGAHPPADAIAGLDDQHVPPGSTQGACRGQPGQPRPDDDHLGGLRQGGGAGRHAAAGLPSKRSQRNLQGRVPELVAALLQHAGEHLLPGEEQVVGQLGAEQQLRADGGDGQERGTSQDLRQGLRELRVRHRVGGGEVDRPGHLGAQEVHDGAHLVVDRDPALPLPPVAELPAAPELEQRQLLLQRAAQRAEDDAGADVGHPDPGLLGRRRSPASQASHTSARKPVPAAAALVEHLVASVAVAADGRARHQHLRPLLEPGQRTGEQHGARSYGCGGSRACSRRSSGGPRCRLRPGGPRRPPPRARRRRWSPPPGPS